MTRRTNSYVWSVTDLGPGKFGVQCPRCDGKCVVSKRMWLGRLRKMGWPMVACIYCGSRISLPQSILKGR